MNKITIGEYILLLTDAVSKNPDIASQSLYSPEGILFGWEDHNDTARRFGVSEFDIRTFINQDKLEGVRSNDHIIVPKTSSKPEDIPLPNFMEGFEDDGERYSGLISE
ncbi:MAG: hypothetical protein IKU67_05685 [Firmicutes bacterium]|nr:hypothetical protein [Bacillota bacterium]